MVRLLHKLSWRNKKKTFEEAINSYYQDYYDRCQQENEKEGGCYTDLEIKGNTMSFVGENGQWIFQKIQK